MLALIPFWAIFLLLCGILIRPLRVSGSRSTTPPFWLLTLSFVVFLAGLSLLAVYPPTPAAKFERTTGTPFPKNATDVQHEFFGTGGLFTVDQDDTYYFETTPAEVDRLAKSLQLKRGRYVPGMNTLFNAIPGAPDFNDWPNAIDYRARSMSGVWYWMITDQSKTHVYLNMGTT